METGSILLAIRPLHYQGQQLLKEAWSPFCNGLRETLRQNGFEEDDSGEALLLFTFPHPCAAITAVVNRLRAARQALRDQLHEQPFPLQIIVHLNQGEGKNISYRNPDAGLWEMLPLETIQVTKPLRAVWDGLMAQRALPPHTLENEDGGLFSLKMEHDDDLTVEALLPSRELPVQGPEPPCFYCGMRRHRPGQCPSKLLLMEHNGLAATGYLPLSQLRAVHAKVFSRPESITGLLSAGGDPSQVRKNPGLMILTAFFDLNRVYQLRFLWNIGFSRYSKWQSVVVTKSAAADNKNLQLGLDCLRVGKYGPAEEFFGQEYHSKSSKKFAAAIGLALAALEQQGLAAMRSYLEVAKTMASQPKERIYIDLLLTRFYDLAGETWKSRDIIKNTVTYQEDCPEAIYRKLQLEAKGSFTAEASQLLRTLLLDHRAFFIAALIDPTLAPISSKIEDLLVSQFEGFMSSAQGLLAQASQEITALKLWFPAREPELEANSATLEKLTQRLDRQSYFDAIDVEHKTKSLLNASRQLKERKLNELYDQIARAKKQVAEGLCFWLDYRYQVFFRDYSRRLLPLDKDTQDALKLAKANEGSSYLKAVELLARTEQALKTLTGRREQMQWVALLLDSGISFVKKLAILELAGALLAVSLAAGISKVAGETGGELGKLVSDPLFQKKALLFTGLVLAPLLALSWTAAEQRQDP